MADLGKVLIVVGGLAIVAGLAFVLLGRAHVPLGRLPGDIVYRGKNSTFYFPLASFDTDQHCAFCGALLNWALPALINLCRLSENPRPSRAWTDPS